jgi:hypothetical protein
LPGQWGGLIFNAGSSASIDNALITYAGGRIPIEGDFDQFNAIEVHQAELRLANSILENNASGLASSNRNGRGPNRDAVVFIRGAQPVILDNTFRDNNLNPLLQPTSTHLISVNANALLDEIQGDTGRTTGAIDKNDEFASNRGPLIRNNLIDNNGVNGMEVRGEELTAVTVWDDTDIVHVLREPIVVMNQYAGGGMRLLSHQNESLVIKPSSWPAMVALRRRAGRWTLTTGLAALCR